MHSLSSVPGSLLLTLLLLGIPIWFITCDTISELKSHIAASNLLLMGLQEDHLLLITHNRDDSPMQVYAIPVNRIAHDSIALHNLKPVSLQTKWPNLWNDRNFSEKVMNSVKFSFVLSAAITLESEKIMIVFASYVKDGLIYLETVTYTINTAVSEYFEYPVPKFDNTSRPRFVSSNEIGVFYSIHIYNESYEGAVRVTQLRKYVSNSSFTGFDMPLEGKLCTNGSSSNGTTTENVVFVPSKSDCTSVNWDIRYGFTDGMYFRIFASDKVYIFEHASLGFGTEIRVIVVQTDDYLVDFPLTTTTTTPTTTPTTSTPTPNISSTTEISTSTTIKTLSPSTSTFISSSSAMKNFPVVQLALGAIIVVLLILLAVVTTLYCFERSKVKVKQYENNENAKNNDKINIKDNENNNKKKPLTKKDQKKKNKTQGVSKPKKISSASRSQGISNSVIPYATTRSAQASRSPILAPKTSRKA